MPQTAIDAALRSICGSDSLDHAITDALARIVDLHHPHLHRDGGSSRRKAIEVESQCSGLVAESPNQLSLPSPRLP